MTVLGKISGSVDCFGEDSWLPHSLQYYIIGLFEIVAFYFIQHHRNPFVAIFIVYGLLPLLDELCSQDWRNPSAAEFEQLSNQLRFKVPLYFNMAVDWYYTVVGLRLLAETEVCLQELPFILGTLYIMGNLTAVGFMFSHEAFHKDNLIQKIVGTLHMSKSLYMHFTVEHLYGHHKNVGTPSDPASARLGELLYSFVPKSVVGSLKSCYRLEAEKFGRPWYFNLAVLSMLANVAIVAGVYKFCGTATLVYFLVLAFQSIFLLQTINYIEHYGLHRNLLPDGTYEPVNITHSWNSSHRFTNYLLFKLQRHSDHHENAFKKYQVLSSLPDSPQLPHGYPVCVLMALLWPLWDYVLTPYAKEYQENKGKALGKDMATFARAEEMTRNFVYGVSGLLLYAAYALNQDYR